MKLFRKMVTKSSVLAIALMAATVIGFGGRAQAACVQYDPNATTPTTPVFNNICNVPNGVGNEPDFVRIRQSANGNDEDNQNNPTYTVGTLNASCNAGDKFDIWTYIHNNAVSGYNNNGTGSAVAHDVQLALNAPGLNTQNNKFNFMSAVSASNAAGVQDSATLDCNGKTMKLTLVPSTVHVYSQQYNWQDLADSSVNSTFKIGSPVVNSGDQWGCWEYRIVVVYQVTVSEVTPPPSSGVCSVLDFAVLDNTKRQVSVNNITADTTNAQVIGYKIDWGDNTSTNAQSGTHTYTSVGPFTITGSVEIQLADNSTQWVSSAGCTHQVSFSVTPPPTPPQTPPTSLVNTGAGDVAGIFTGTTVAGAFLHRKWLSRRSK